MVEQIALPSFQPPLEPRSFKGKEPVRGVRTSGFRLKTGMTGSGECERVGLLVSKQRRRPCVYLLASGRNGTLYVGVTSDLIRRVWQHKSALVEGFTKQYGVKQLVWFEAHDTMESAIGREKSIKAWKRGWKLALIENLNPEWRDLYEDLV